MGSAATVAIAGEALSERTRVLSVFRMARRVLRLYVGTGNLRFRYERQGDGSVWISGSPR